MDIKYISAKEVKKVTGIHSSTLRRWAEGGKITCVRAGEKGRRLYPKNDLSVYLGLKSPSESKQTKTNVIYARVSSSHQKSDLDRQIKLLRDQYPDHTLISDVGSGLNWKRAGIRSLLERVHAEAIQEVVVTDKDRLCRFGFDLLDWFFKKHDVKIVVHCKYGEGSKSECALSDDVELSQDILAVCNYFVAKNNGKRAQRNRRMREQGK